MTATPTIETDWALKGVDATILENEYLRLTVLTGKGSDILEFRDKRRDVNVLFDPSFDWTPPTQRDVPAADVTTWQTDCYPGGWQLNLPIAGYGAEIDGCAYGLHGESALRPWTPHVTEDTDVAVALHCECDLLRYPFHVERELRLPAGEPALEIEETVTNEGAVDLEYVWQQHVALGPPLVGPSARLDLPATTGRVEDYAEGMPNARLESDATFEWPEAPAATADETVDLSTSFPDRDANVHDLAYATELDAGWYALTNPELDLGFALTFPTDPFECVWYWQPFGGYEDAPFYGRNYNVGLEPTTAYPGSGLFDEQRANDTIDVLEAGESISASYVARTFTGHKGVQHVAPDGSIGGAS